jgi:hypothetical protein
MTAGPVRHWAFVILSSFDGDEEMERFSSRYSGTDEPVEVQILDAVGSDVDEYREVRLLFPSGKSYRAVFWRDPMRRGGHWWEQPGMAIVQDLTTEEITSTVEEVLKGGELEDSFEPV